MRSIIDAFGCMPPVDGVSEIDPSCPRCLGSGSVCEDHPQLPWDGLTPEGCQCGAAGMPCWEGRDRLALLDIATAPAFSHGRDPDGFPKPCDCADEANLDGPEA
jgi:hypothetical protein